MPVFPEVDSTTVLRPGSIRPSASAASIIATPIRSLTLPPGLCDSSLAISSAPQSGATRVSRTIGVLPTRSARLSGIALAGGETVMRRRGYRALFASFDRVADQPEHRGPQPHEESAPLGVPALFLIHGLRPYPQRHAEPHGRERDDVQIPAAQARLVELLAEHAARVPRRARGYAAPRCDDKL